MLLIKGVANKKRVEYQKAWEELNIFQGMSRFIELFGRFEVEYMLP